jgi:hypoxanthine phosphoribosyltransferase
MEYQIPENFDQVYSAESIKERVHQLGELITPWARSVFSQSGKDVMAIPILRGGLFFFSDLVRVIEASVEIAPVQTWAYEIGKNDQKRGGVRIASDHQVSGKCVLLVDDICDSGRTLSALSQFMLAQGAAQVKSVVLIRRDLPEAEGFIPDWVGFSFSGREWFVGYGMEDKERWRNLPSVYIIKS